MRTNRFRTNDPPVLPCNIVLAVIRRYTKRSVYVPFPAENTHCTETSISDLRAMKEAVFLLSVATVIHRNGAPFILSSFTAV